MSSVPTDIESYTQYTEYLFPDISADCESYSSLTQGGDLSPAVVDWIVNHRQNYVPWCSEIQGFINTAKENVVQTLTDAVGSFSTVGDEIDWGYNLMTVILANKGCTQDVIDSYTQAYSSNVTTMLMQSQYWSSSMGMMSEMIPSMAIYGFYQNLQNVLYDPSVVSPLKQLKLVNFA